MSSPPTGAWTIRTWWTFPGEEVFTVTNEEHPTWESARREALHLCCIRGTVAVVLYDPLGDVFGHWDRFSNVAHNLGNRADIKARAG